MGFIFEQTADYEEYRYIGTFPIKYAENLANHPRTVHVIYSNNDGDNFPYLSYFTFGEIPLVTSPGSQVPQIYR
jgi:hypothetical protein